MRHSILREGEGKRRTENRNRTTTSSLVVPVYAARLFSLMVCPSYFPSLIISAAASIFKNG
jgi:hypothetical protein